MNADELRTSIWKNRFSKLTGCDKNEIQIARSKVNDRLEDTIIYINDVFMPDKSNAVCYMANYVAIACNPILSAFLFTSNKYAAYNEQVYSNYSMDNSLALNLHTKDLKPTFRSAIRYVVPAYSRVHFILFVGIAREDYVPKYIIGDDMNVIASKQGVYASFSGSSGKFVTETKNHSLHEDSYKVISNPLSIEEGNIESNIITGLAVNHSNDREIEKVLALLVHREITSLIGCEKSGTESILDTDIDIQNVSKIYYQNTKYVNEEDVLNEE